MSVRSQNVFMLVSCMTALLIAHCGEGPEDDGTDTASDADTDTDGDTDSDVDGDSDSDTDSDSGSDGDAPLEDLSELVGVTFVIEIEKRDWRAPTESVGDELDEYIPKFTFEVVGVDDTTLEVVLGSTEEGVQMACNEAKSVEVDASANPEFQLGPTTLQIVVEGPDDIAMTTIIGFTVTGTLEEIGEDEFYFLGDFEAIMDTSETAKLFAELYPDRADRTPENICTTISNIAGENKCFACEEGDAEEYCTTMRAKPIEGKMLEVTLEEQEADNGCLN